MDVHDGYEVLDLAVSADTTQEQELNAAETELLAEKIAWVMRLGIADARKSNDRIISTPATPLRFCLSSDLALVIHGSITVSGWVDEALQAADDLVSKVSFQLEAADVCDGLVTAPLGLAGDHYWGSKPLPAPVVPTRVAKR